MTDGQPHIYAIALGSNQPRSRSLPPKAILARAVEELARARFRLLDQSPVIETPPVGPSLRRYANAAILIESELGPDALLNHLQAMERAAGRRTRQRWGARPLDLDIILWSGGTWASAAARPNLIIPHLSYRERDFVLIPLNHIAPAWKDPVTGKTIAQLLAKLKKPRILRKCC